jgi:nicotinate (nicotinamide) nucleotide adenylyltransferase
MEFFRRAAGAPGSLGILPGTFNPPTRAHMGLAEAGLAVVDEVVFVLPRVLPHKTYAGVGFEDRLRMLEAAVASQPRCSIAASPEGLFIDIARRCRKAYGPDVALKFLCGRDAAERIVNWDYGRPGAFPEMLHEFGMLVAGRQGTFEIAPGFEDAIRLLPMPPDYDEISATRVREAMAAGRAWEQWVPEAVAPLARRLYAQRLSP